MLAGVRMAQVYDSTRMTWWAWLLTGILLLGGEMLTPGGFYLMFFGLAAVAVGLIALAGAALPSWAEWLLFTVLSIAATLLFRRPLLRKIEATTPNVKVDDLVGETAQPVAAIPAGAVGRAELRGTVWTARNAGTRDVNAGERCRVIGVEGLLLLIRSEM
jgi:hypothetical protein